MKFIISSGGHISLAIGFICNFPLSVNNDDLLVENNINDRSITSLKEDMF